MLMNVAYRKLHHLPNVTTVMDGQKETITEQIRSQQSNITGTVCLTVQRLKQVIKTQKRIDV